MNEAAPTDADVSRPLPAAASRASEPLRIVAWQAATAMAVAAALAPFGAGEAGSALFGGVAVVAPNAWFAIAAAGRGASAAAPRLLVRGAAKWLLAALLMAGGLALAPIKPLGFFAALIAALAAGALAPLWIGRTS